MASSQTDLPEAVPEELIAVPKNSADSQLRKIIGSSGSREKAHLFRGGMDPVRSIGIPSENECTESQASLPKTPSESEVVMTQPELRHPTGELPSLECHSVTGPRPSVAVEPHDFGHGRNQAQRLLSEHPHITDAVGSRRREELVRVKDHGVYTIDIVMRLDEPGEACGRSAYRVKREPGIEDEGGRYEWHYLEDVRNDSGVAQMTEPFLSRVVVSVANRNDAAVTATAL